MKPAFLDQEILFTAENWSEKTIKAQVTAGDQTLTEIMFSVGEPTPQVPVGRGTFEHVRAIARDVNVLGNDEGHLPLQVDARILKSLCPKVAQTIDHGITAVVLATTRLVGMVCPGLHSLFAGLELAFHDSGPERCQHLMRYEVTRFDRRFNMVDIGVKDRIFHGKLNTFVRPSPASQLSMARAAMLVKSHLFQGQRALVVGGSRGVGEVTAKLLSAGGAHVTLTYSAGREDAERIVAEIGANGVADPAEVMGSVLLQEMKAGDQKMVVQGDG